MDAWYVINTKPNAEGQVEYALKLRGLESYLPRLISKTSATPEALFPAYLFVRCDLDIVEMSSFQYLPGVRRLLCFDGRPAILPDDTMALIQQKTAQINAQGGLPAHNMEVGDEVLIEQGPLRGLHGIFRGPTRAADRVYILVQLLGKANRAEIPVAALRRLTPNGQGREHNRTTRGRGRRINNSNAG